MNRWNLRPRELALLPLFALLASCGQLELKGAADPCPHETGLEATEIQSCIDVKRKDLRPAVRSGEPVEGLFGEGLPIAGRRLRHAVALDYSGSMYGGYSNDVEGEAPCGWHLGPGEKHIRNGPYYWEQEAFAQFLAAGPLGALSGGEAVHPLVFNRYVTALGINGELSTFDPATQRYSTPLPPPVQGVERLLETLTSTGTGRLPANPAQAGFGDPRETRLDDVLTAAAALFETFEERDGVLWIVTDNIIERDAARDDVYNKNFYRSLNLDPRWQVAHAWPIHGASWLCGSTLMVYGLYYCSRSRIAEKAYFDLSQGEEAQIGHASQIEIFKKYSSSSSPAQGQPFKLKPGDLDVVRVSFLGNVLCEKVRVGLPSKCEAKIQVENLLYHRKIKAAKISLVNDKCTPWEYRGNRVWPFKIAVPFCSGEIRQSIQWSETLMPGVPASREIEFMAPPVRMELITAADHWASAGVPDVLMIGRMNVEIDGVETEMVIPTESLKNIYGVESLPDEFRNQSSDRLQPTGICLPIFLRNPSQLASILLLLCAALAAILGPSLYWLLKASYRTVLIDGAPQGVVRLVRFRATDLIFRAQRIGRIRLGAAGHPKVHGAPGHKIVKRGQAWIYKDEQGGTEHRIEVVSKRTPPPPRGNDVF